MNRENVIVNKTFDFAMQIIDIAKLLEENKKFVISNQLLKSGISIGGIVKEAQDAESMDDFIHKMKIVIKEADENEYWLMLCKHSKKYTYCDEQTNQLTEILIILNSIIFSSVTKNKQKKIINIILPINSLSN